MIMFLLGNTVFRSTSFVLASGLSFQVILRTGQPVYEHDRCVACAIHLLACTVLFKQVPWLTSWAVIRDGAKLSRSLDFPFF